MKRYQVYLHPHSVSIFDEVAEIWPFTRSELLRKVVDTSASKVANILAAIKPVSPKSYSELDKLVGALKVKSKKAKYLSQNIDEIYYK